jgi:hypothetical protein
MLFELDLSSVEVRDSMSELSRSRGKVNKLSNYSGLSHCCSV